MIRVNEIVNFANGRGAFSCREIKSYMSVRGEKYSGHTLNSSMFRMVENGILKKSKRGVYEISSNIFMPTWNAEMEKMLKEISAAFPLLRFCIWDIKDLRRFSHHIVNSQIIYVDVEKDGIESVFNFLQNLDTQGRMAFLQPSEKDYVRYINSKPVIVVRQLVTRAPLFDQRKATIEKIMIDANVDHDFFAFQGFEMERIFHNIYSLVKVNERKLLAYAKRRHCSQKIQQLINDKDSYGND